MEIVLWLLVAALTVGFAYTMQFTAATLSMGKELGNALTGTSTKTGVQDAVTPPWQTNLVLTVYAGIAVVEGVMWWWLGWVSALVALAAMLPGASVVKLVLPKPSGSHYRRLILQSMMNRYANYVRDGDVMRADAMKHLLVLAGFDPDVMRGR